MILVISSIKCKLDGFLIIKNSTHFPITLLLNETNFASSPDNNSIFFLNTSITKKNQQTKLSYQEETDQSIKIDRYTGNRQHSGHGPQPRSA